MKTLARTSKAMLFVLAALLLCAAAVLSACAPDGPGEDETGGATVTQYDADLDASITMGAMGAIDFGGSYVYYHFGVHYFISAILSSMISASSRFVMSGSSSVLSRVIIVAILVSVPNPAPASETSFATTMSAFFFFSLSFA